MSDTAQQGVESATSADAQVFDGTTSFSQVNDRLKEIVAAVEDDNMPLDDALTLFEEAVGLGMQASSLLEQDMSTREGAVDAASQGAPESENGAVAATHEANDSEAAAADAAPHNINGSVDTAADASDSLQQQSGSQSN